MVSIRNPDNEPDFLVSVRQCADCETDPEECTDDMKSSCPFHKIRMQEQEKSKC
jgi:hypothetical protein